MAARPDAYPYERRLAHFEAVCAGAQRTIAAQIEAALASGDLETAMGRRAQLAAVDATLQQLAAEVDPLARQLVLDAYHQAAQRAQQQIAKLTVATAEKPGAFHGVSREAVQVMQQSITQALDTARRTVGRQVADIYAREQRRAALRALLGAEGSPQQASRQLQQRLLKDRDIRRAVRDGRTGFVDKAGRRWSLEAYSNMAVRTVTREAVVQGALARMASHGIAIGRVTTHPGACEICVPFQGTLVDLAGTGVTEYRGEAVSDTGELPPFHPNAVIEGTRVLPIGSASGGVRAAWRGPLVHLATRGGIELSIGPNHPVLTSRGWLAAKLVTKGDHVIRRIGRQWMGTTLRPAAGRMGLADADDQLDDAPALIEQIFDALHAAGVHSRVVAAPGHLHGDGNFCEGEIDVVRADRSLALVGDAALVEPARETVLVGAHTEPESLPGKGASVLALGRIDRTASGRMGRLSGSRTDSDAACLESFLERPRVDTDLLREMSQRLTCGVAFDEIVEVRDVESWTGHAFDLETPSAAYFANDMLVHNCAHSIMPVSGLLDSVLEELEEEGVPA